MSGLSRHRSAPAIETLRVSRTATLCSKLGPGSRSVIWVAGCQLRCSGCIAEDLWDLGGGEEHAVADVARALLTVPDSVGVTFSGGEPFLQAAALAELVDLVRSVRPEYSVMSYSGYRLEMLRDCGDAGFARLLSKLDILVDSPYVERFAGSFLWRGSSNQRLHVLTDEHPEVCDMPDLSVGLEIGAGPSGELFFNGVPDRPGFTERLANAVSDGDAKQLEQ